MPAELVQRGVERGAGELDQPVIGLVHFDDQIDRAGDRQRADEQRRDDAAIGGREQAEARQDDGEPEHQDGQERPLNAAAGLLGDQPACLGNISAELQGRRLEPALRVILGRKSEEQALNGLGAGAAADGPDW